MFTELSGAYESGTTGFLVGQLERRSVSAWPPSRFLRISPLLISGAGRVTVGTLPDPAPAGYGGTFEGEVGVLTIQQAGWPEEIHDRTLAGVTFVSPVLASGNALLVRGDDYLQADGRALAWTNDNWPVLTAGSVLFKLASPPLREGLPLHLLPARDVQGQAAYRTSQAGQ